MDFNDLSVAYADFAVPVIHTPLIGIETPGLAIFDQPGTTIISGEVLATDYALRFATTTFQAVKRGDAFLVGGVTYTARENAQPANVDGLEQIVPLARASA